MIISIWKPHYYKGTITHYEIRDNISELSDLKGKTAYKVIWLCDSDNCRTPEKIHSISACHLKKDKMSLDLQICRSCQCTGEGNGRYGDNRTWDELMGTEKSNQLKSKYRKRWSGKNNPSHSDIVKEKKNQTIINEETLPYLLEDINFKLIKILKLEGKNSKLMVKCSNGHVSSRTYSNLFKKDKKYRCEKCFYSDIKLDLTDEELNMINSYKRQVRSLTKQTYKKYKKEINPLNLKIGRGLYHLDHKYSINEGYKNNIDVKIISSKENLQVISESENCSKQSNCSIKLSELINKTKYLL